MSLENLPVWSFEPEWSSKVSETFEWLTKILKSRIGAEQRRALRYSPRRYIEYTSIVHKDRRALFDNMVNGIGIGDYYLPIWHEAYVVDSYTPNAVYAPGAVWSDIRPGDPLWLQGEGVEELHEVQAVEGARIVLADVVGASGARDLVAYPVRRVRFTELPSMTRRTDNLAVIQTKFRVIGFGTVTGEDIDRSGLDQLARHRGIPVISLPPDEKESLEYGFERITESIDNRTSDPMFTNTSPVPFTTQKYTWHIVGQEEYRRFVNLLEAIRGRFTTFFLPTFFADFENTRSVVQGSTRLYVRNSGFAQFAKNMKNRGDIHIEYDDGVHFFSRIISADVVDDREERLELASPLPGGNPVMVSFLVESRFDQDNIELSHDTDTAGVTVASVLIRGTPTIRRALPAA